LTRVFFLQLRVQGSTMGTSTELHELTQLLDLTGIRPLVDRVLPVDRAREGFEAMIDGDLFGKIVFSF
jgi:D-arabinose 1-dehydrogenase-like Zn-dependent alcohol dehydrogenase